jgi:hypothetical protein
MDVVYLKKISFSKYSNMLLSLFKLICRYIKCSSRSSCGGGENSNSKKIKKKKNDDVVKLDEDDDVVKLDEDDDLYML